MSAISKLRISWCDCAFRSTARVVGVDCDTLYHLMKSKYPDINKKLSKEGFNTPNLVENLRSFGYPALRYLALQPNDKDWYTSLAVEMTRLKKPQRQFALRFSGEAIYHKSGQMGHVVMGLYTPPGELCRDEVSFRVNDLISIDGERGGYVTIYDDQGSTKDYKNLEFTEAGTHPVQMGVDCTATARYWGWPSGIVYVEG